MKRYLLLTILAIILTIGFIFVFGLFSHPVTAPKSEEVDPEGSVKPENTALEAEVNPNPATVKDESYSKPEKTPRPIGDVPFTVQAPGAAWDDPTLQDGCEEASLLMAMAWLRSEALPGPDAVADTIHALVAFEKERFGHHEDISLPELATVMREYFDHEDIRILESVTIEHITTEIRNGNLVLAPAYGRALRNPYFTPPGPITHMLVLIGYDPESREFVVNDPGTVRGASYRYDEDVLYEAIWAYPSGPTHPEPPESAHREKSVLVIPR